MSAGEQSGQQTNQQPVDPASLRATYWENIDESVQHIRASIKSEGNKLRASDYISLVMVPTAAMALATCSLTRSLLAVRPWLVLTYLLVTLYFIGQRIGIIKSMTPRQTYLIFYLLINCVFLGATGALMLFEILRNLP